MAGNAARRGDDSNMNVGKLASFGLNFATFWGLIVALGYMVNVLCSQEFRLGVSSKLFHKPSAIYLTTGDLTRISGLFVSNTLYKLFRGNPFSLRSVTVSIFLSVLFQLAVILVIVALGEFDALRDYVVIPIFQQNIVSCAVCIFSIVLMDYLSFMQTMYFMSYGSRASLFSLLFTAYADLFLSINIFLLIFPVFVIAYVLGHSDVHGAAGILVYNSVSTSEVRDQALRKIQWDGKIQYLNLSYADAKGIEHESVSSGLIPPSPENLALYKSRGISAEDVPNYIEDAYSLIYFDLISSDPNVETAKPESIFLNGKARGIRIKPFSPLSFFRNAYTNLPVTLWTLYGSDIELVRHLRRACRRISFLLCKKKLGLRMRMEKFFV